MKIYRCFPTLDVSIDVKAETEEKALEIMSDRIKDIREEFLEKLYKLGFLECGCDFDYSTDEWDESLREDGDPVPITGADNHRPMKRDGSFYWYNQHGEIPDYDWWKNDPVQIFKRRLGDYETELVTVYAIEDPKTWIVHHQDVTGTLNYQREFESEDVAMSHARSLKMHFSDKPLAEGVTPKFRMI